MEPGAVLGIVFAIIAIVVIAVISYRMDKERRRALRAWARSKKLRMRHGRRVGWEKEYPAFGMFKKGRSRHSALHVGGEIEGHKVNCLDYKYTTGSGKNQQTHRRAVVILAAGGPVIPLRIRREHIFDKVGEFLGHDDIDFESAEFSRKFHVSSSDRKWAYDVVHQRTMDYLLKAPSVNIEFGYAEIAVWCNGSLNAQHADTCLEVARRMLDLVPDDVLAQLKGSDK